MKIRCPTCNKLLVKLDLEDCRVQIEFTITCYNCGQHIIDDFGFSRSEFDADHYAINHDYEDKEKLK